MPSKIHPGIGIGRIGDSPEFFIGPETVDLPPAPAGGYRDANDKIRRQAARFRLFDGATPIVHSAGTSIQWSVTLQRKYGLSPGSQSISGASQIASVVAPDGSAIAEIRTDADGNLLVLSIEIGSTTYDGGCDGLIEASVTTAGVTATAVSAWVALVPPDFAPGVYPKFPYHLFILDYLVAQGVISPPADGVNVSFQRDLYPLLRGRTDLTPSALQALATRADREAAVGSLSGYALVVRPGDYCRALLKHWLEGWFDADGGTPTPLSPSELDRGPLCHVDGECPYSGWELSLLPITGANPIAAGETLRFAAGMSFGIERWGGWIGDLPACTMEWITPVKAPSGFGRNWVIRGFTVRTGAGLEYQEFCPQAELLTSQLDFGRVQRGSGAARAVEIRVANFPQADVVRFQSLPPNFSVLQLSQPFGPINESPPQIRSFWVFFQADNSAPLGSIAPGTFFEIEVAGTIYPVEVLAEVVDADATQIGLVLDYSLSMYDDRGDGLSKFLGLTEAVDVLITAARPGDGIAVAPFSSNFIAPGHVAESFGGGGDSARSAVRAYMTGLSPVSRTSIGDGLVAARTLLGRTTAAFTQNALVVVTDGQENEPVYVDDVASSIDNRTFAIGIGTSTNVDADVLADLADGRDGVLLLTGPTLSGANSYRLEKYFLQILAGASNEEVILDPVGTLPFGSIARIPIPVTEAEFRLDTFVVSNQAKDLALALQGPDGQIRTLESLVGLPGVHIAHEARVAMMRVPLPFAIPGVGVWGPGNWHLLIARRRQDWSAAHGFASSTHVEARPPIAVPSNGPAVSYAAVVNARSAIRMRAHVARPSALQQHFVIEASATYLGVPLMLAPAIVATVVTPEGLTLELPLTAAEPGRFLARFQAARPGTYDIRIRAHGSSPGGHLFARELTFTPVIAASGAGAEGRRCCRRPDISSGREAKQDASVRTHLGRACQLLRERLAKLCAR